MGVPEMRFPRERPERNCQPRRNAPDRRTPPFATRRTQEKLRPLASGRFFPILEKSSTRRAPAV